MAMTFNFGPGAQSETTVALNVKPWNYSGAFKTAQKNATYTLLIDTKTDLGNTVSVKRQCEPVSNVYSTVAADNIPVANRYTVVAGTKVTSEAYANGSYEVTSQTTTSKIVSPARCRIQFWSGNDPNWTNDDFATLLTAAIAGLMDQEGNFIVTDELRRGLLSPTGV
mgnify:CR=1 FL=1